MTKVRKAKRKKHRRRRARINNGSGNHHARVHRSEGRRQAGVALHVYSEQEKPPDPKPAGEEEIQSVLASAYASPRNSVSRHATENRQTPFEFPSCESHDAAPPHRHCD